MEKKENFAMVLRDVGAPLVLERRPIPQPTAGELLIEVSACGVCRTDLHVVDGELQDLKRPVVPGHEVIGQVAAIGPGVENFSTGQRVGVPWLGWTCGECEYCRDGKENLCLHPEFTGYHRDGGYAGYVLADHRYCFPISGDYSDEEAAPLLCAGLIGYRSLKMAGDAKYLGIYGFGAAAHIVIQVAHYKGCQTYTFVRDGDQTAKNFALEMGATWAGWSSEKPPQLLDATIIFAPVGDLVPLALKSVKRGGTVVCAGIHMSDIPQFPYNILWHERRIVSVANLTRQDGEEFLALAPKVPIQTHTTVMPLSRANEALDKLRRGDVQGALVLDPRATE
jgi:alcohol dehydrogenase, propanol-preferring